MAARRRKSNPALDAKRDEIKRLHRNATKKISRLKSSGVQLTAHGIDPRIELEKIQRYNSTQLDAYAKRLQEFTSRRTAFVPGAEGKPLDKAKWRRLQKLTAQHNAIGTQRMAERGNIKLPGQDTTLQQKHNDIVSRVRARGDVYNYPYEPLRFNSTDIVNIDKLIKDMEKKNNREFFPNLLKDQRKQLRQMMDYVGDNYISHIIDKMDDRKFDILFNDAGFADYYSRKYTNAKATESGQGHRGSQGIEEDADSDIWAAIKWVQELPTPRGKA